MLSSIIFCRTSGPPLAPPLRADPSPEDAVDEEDEEDEEDAEGVEGVEDPVALSAPPPSPLPPSSPSHPVTVRTRAAAPTTAASLKRVRMMV
ncbi:hypothetical protein ACFWY6_32595 [Streptomyces sp. NPDC059037]|uniref:hypothetical protein n=1 Tax=Streptomyces sp. NPDC059037 TaxID=3346710 RepID=UPI0036848CE5